MRAFTQLRLTKEHCMGLREAVRPFADAGGDVRLLVDFCTRLYLALYSLEADPDIEAWDFPVNPDEIMVINNFLSAEDGDWAGDVLRQSRQVLYELTMGREAIMLASEEDMEKALDAVVGPAKEEGKKS